MFFSGQSFYNDYYPCLWLVVGYIFDFLSATSAWISTKLDWFLTSVQCVLFRPYLTLLCINYAAWISTKIKEKKKMSLFSHVFVSVVQSDLKLGQCRPAIREKMTHCHWLLSFVRFFPIMFTSIFCLYVLLLLYQRHGCFEMLHKEFYTIIAQSEVLSFICIAFCSYPCTLVSQW